MMSAVRTGEAAGADPAADFRPFPQLCTVTSSTYEWDSKCEDDMSEHCHYQCHANWQYSFCVDTGPGSAVSACGYQSRTEEKLVCDGPCSRCNKAATPTFVPDQQTKCWKPAPGFNPIDTHYRCGNTTICYKIFDPADDLKAAIDENKTPLIVGVILLLIGETAIVRTWDPPTQHHRSLTARLIPCVASRSCQAVWSLRAPAGRTLVPTVRKTGLHHSHAHRPRLCFLCLRAAVLRKRWATSRPVALK